MRKIKELYYSLLRAFFADVPVSLYRLLLLGLIVYSILPFFFYPNEIFYRTYYYLSYLTLGILIICIITYIPIRIYLKNYYLNIQTKKMGAKHLAIVLVRYNVIYKTFFYVLTHFRKFFSILSQNNIPYVVYVIDAKDELIRIVENKNVKALFIFGHGRRHGVKFGNEVWSYYHMPKVKHILYAGQFHCNHESGKSLYEHLDCNGTLIDGVTLSYDINDYFESKEYIPIFRKIFSIRN